MSELLELGCQWQVCSDREPYARATQVRVDVERTTRSWNLGSATSPTNGSTLAGIDRVAVNP